MPNHWGLAFCPDEETLVLRTIVSRSDRSPSATADRVVEQYLAIYGTKFTDDAERQIERLLFRAGK